jgi:Uri superfamily endonuclease
LPTASSFWLSARCREEKQLCDTTNGEDVTDLRASTVSLPFGRETVKGGTEESHEELFERGTYVLVLKLTGGLILNVGSIGRIRFAAGYYAYVGSARRGMRARVARHLAREKKKWWHIDWLTTQAGVVPTAIASTERIGLECRIASALSNRANLQVKGFGCSDCKCGSHLFYFSDATTVSAALKGLGKYGVSVEKISFADGLTHMPG